MWVSAEHQKSEGRLTIKTRAQEGPFTAPVLPHLLLLEAASLSAPLRRAFLRLAVHDALTFEIQTRTGGPTAALRVDKALAYPGHAPARPAAEYLATLSASHPILSVSDILYLVAHVVAVQGGIPALVFHPGRKTSRVVAPPHRLPAWPQLTK